VKNGSYLYICLSLLASLFCFNASAEISLAIISKEQNLPEDILRGLGGYIPEFSHRYYREADESIKPILENLGLNYRPVVIYDKDKLEDFELKLLKEKWLLEEKGDYLLFPFGRLYYLTSVELLNRTLKPNELGIFSMSLCPYGKRALVNIVHHIKRYNLPIDLKLYFIADYEDGYLDSMHGVDEVEEDIHQLLIQKYWPDKFFDYLLLTDSMSRFQALGELGISYKKIDSLRTKGGELLIENIKTASGLGIDASPIFLWQNKHIILGLEKVIDLLDSFKEDYYSSILNSKAGGVMAVYFSSPNCGFCRVVENKIIPQLYSDFSGLIDIVKFDISEPGKYEFMLKMEKYYNIDKSGVPKIFIADEALVGKFEIEEDVHNAIKNALKYNKGVFPDPKKPIELDYFYSSSNIKRDKAAFDIYQNFIPKIEKRYRGKVKIKKYNITEREGFDYILNKTEEIKGRENFYTPTVILDDRIIQKSDMIYGDLDFIIQDKLVSGVLGDKGDILLSNIESFSLTAIISAGLLDGINPCAFTVIIFFISFLTMTGYKRREMAYVGCAFIFSVFIAYLLIGIGLFSAFYRLSIYRTFADIMSYILIAGVFILALLNLYDFSVYKLKGSSGLILKLPHRIKFLIQKTIGKGYRKDSFDAESRSIFKLSLLALGVGFIVSVLESVCTGQVYFPTIAFIANLPGMVKVKALGYLALYNIMFIFPLIVIFLLGLWGLKSNDFSNFMKNNLAGIKLLTALLFIALGILLIYAH
jgi:hypothetical protein